MALISTKGIYGLSALCEIKNNTSGLPLQKREIAIRANIPENYLDILMSKLKKAGIVKSIRGVNGGYILAQDLSTIKVIDVLLILEDDLKVLSTDIEHPVLEPFFEDAKIKIHDIFNLHLTELVEYKKDVLNFII
ncbi:MAG: HTH-type transcriptional regulator IscR [uncultured Sulfurimonas sp.]|nr:MAG: HTH-type transcriptional regulator IscR [uncultured Sulfurimonas sp.]